MRVLQIGSDRGIFNPESASAKRMRAYAGSLGFLDSIVFSLRHHGLSEKELDTQTRVYPTNSFFRFLYGCGALLIGLRTPRPDVVSVQDPFEAGLVGLFISMLRGVPLHVQIHTDFLSPAFAELSAINKVRVFIASIVLRRASRIRVVSERIKNRIQERYRLNSPISVLPIFVDIEKYRNASPDATLEERMQPYKTVLLVVSRLEKEKNVELAITAFARAAIEDSYLLIVGDGSERRHLEEFARRKGVGKWVSFEGRQDAKKYYPSADLVLFPSRYDGYGMVIVEALARGVPVLSTDVGIAREAGAIIASPEDFTKALKEWGERGNRVGHLKVYPYADFDEYVQKYCEDITKCVGKK